MVPDLPVKTRVMSFAQTYKEEVLKSRRDRSRRAFFWARVVGLVLMVTFATTLHRDPALARALKDAAVVQMMRLAGAPTPQTTGAPETAHLPRSRVRINRNDWTDTPGAPAQGFYSQSSDAKSIARDAQRSLSGRTVGQ